MSIALINARVLRDDKLLDEHCVLIDGGRILDVVPAAQARGPGIDRVDLGGGLLLPGFIDTQVNGGGGVLFNDAPSVEAIRQIGRAHRRFGTTGFMPTLISTDLDVVAQAISATRGALATGVPGVLGIHIEGPFLSVERKGVHDQAMLRELDESAVGLLSSLGAGRTIVTLAPEVTTPEIIQRLADAGVIISAGHTNATYAEVTEALRHGLRGFTHLFNAMSQLTSREPGVVGAALEDSSSWCGIIVDGEHIAPPVLRLALRCKPHERFMLVTDAMPALGTELRTFELQGRRIIVSGPVCYDEDGRLAGSNIDLASCVRNAMGLLGLPLHEAVHMASLYPAQFLGLAGELGRIEPGYRANLALTDESLHVRSTWIDGQREDA